MRSTHEVGIQFSGIAVNGIAANLARSPVNFMVDPLWHTWSFNFWPDLSQSIIRSQVAALQFDMETLLTFVHHLLCFCQKCLCVVPWLQFFHCGAYIWEFIWKQRKKICLDSCLSFLEWLLTGEDGPEAAAGKEKIRHQAFSSQLRWDPNMVFPMSPPHPPHCNDYCSMWKANNKQTVCFLSLFLC